LKPWQLSAEAMGFDIVPLPYSEAFTALQLGTVDAFTGGNNDIYLEYRDVIDYAVQTRDHLDIQPIAINLQLWESLSAADQKVLEEAAGATLNWHWDSLVERDEKVKIELEEAGIEVINLTPEEMGAFAKLVREVEWPYEETVIGKILMDKVRATAEPIPE